MAKAMDVVSLAALSRVYVERGTLAAFMANENERSIQNYVGRGLVVRAGHGRYKLVESVSNVFASLREMAAGRVGRDENVDAARANAQLKDTQRRLYEIRIARTEGNLISLPEVKEAWDNVALSIRQMFLSFPARARFDLPHLTGADQKVLERLARDMLLEVSTEGDIVLPIRMVEDDGRAGAI